MKMFKGVYLFAAVVLLSLVLAFILIGCSNDEQKTIDVGLIGKWEFYKMLEGSAQFDLPYNGTYTGGYEFTSNTFSDYRNGEFISSIDAYTEGGFINYRFDNRKHAIAFSINGNELTTYSTIDGRVQLWGKLLKRVPKFSWE